MREVGDEKRPSCSLGHKLLASAHLGLYHHTQRFFQRPRRLPVDYRSPSPPTKDFSEHPHPTADPLCAISHKPALQFRRCLAI